MIFAFCSAVLHEPPDLGLLTRIQEQHLFAEWPLAPSTAKGQEALENLCHLSGNLPEERQALHFEHLRLFSGPSPLIAPWESVWREKDRLLFGEETEKVRLYYAEWGVSVQNERHDPEDHLALELSFLVVLLQNYAESQDRIYLTALNQFMQEHVMQWAVPCLNKVAETAEHPFYCDISILCQETLLSLQKTLQSEK